MTDLPGLLKARELLSNEDGLITWSGEDRNVRVRQDTVKEAIEKLIDPAIAAERQSGEGRARPSGTFAEGVEAAAKVAQKRAEGFHTGECDRGHVEWDTNAFVCSNRNGCLCAEREEEAEAIAIAIRALTPPPPPEVRGDDMSAAARDYARGEK